MSNQLKALNTNIQAKDQKIKRTYRSMKRVRVYFQVVSYTLDYSEQVYESAELTSAKAIKVFKSIPGMTTEQRTVLGWNSTPYIHKLIRVQTGGYVGGIILGGSCEVIETITI